LSRGFTYFILMEPHPSAFSGGWMGFVFYNPTLMKEEQDKLEARISQAWSELVKMEDRIKALPGELDAFNQNISELTGKVNGAGEKIESIDLHFNDYHFKSDAKTKSKLESVVEHHSAIDQFLKGSTELKNELQEFRDFVYGNETLKKEGFKKEIETFYNKTAGSHKGLHDGWQESYDTLYKKIEGLLPGATSTGLAKAYEDQSKNYKLPVTIWSGVFIVTMVFMIWIALNTMKSTTDVIDALLGVLARLPFFVPAIWLAIFASKQQSQFKRLSQEYAYKQTLAKSFEGYKREIQNLPDGDTKNQLLDKLTAAMVDMCAFNPSGTLENKTHDDRPPIPLVKELLEKMDSIIKIKQ
jgi:cell division protein FtsB